MVKRLRKCPRCGERNDGGKFNTCSNCGAACYQIVAVKVECLQDRIDARKRCPDCGEYGCPTSPCGSA